MLSGNKPFAEPGFSNVCELKWVDDNITHCFKIHCEIIINSSAKIDKSIFLQKFVLKDMFRFITDIVAL